MDKTLTHVDADADLMPQQGDAGHAGLGIRLFKLTLGAIFRIFFRVKIVGLKNVPDTAAIICANHLGWTDPFLILLFLPVEPRVYILGERQVAHISRFRNFMITKLQVMVALDRDRPREALRIMSDVLSRGGSLLIFPEGHLGTEEGKLQPLQHGAAHLSQHAGVQLLPVGLTGTSELWLRRRLTVRIGPPIVPADFTGDVRTRTTETTGELSRRMQALLPGDKPHPRVRLLRRWLTSLF
jgi:1-acyl-sn-glycerol-3-phosphate acyltransferase